MVKKELYQPGQILAGLKVLEIISIKYTSGAVTGLHVYHDKCGKESIYRLSYLSELHNHGKIVEFCKQCRERGRYNEEKNPSSRKIEGEILDYVNSVMPISSLPIKAWCDHSAVRF